MILTGPRPGVFAPHYDLGEIADGAEQLGMSTPFPAARVGIAAVAAMTKVPGAESLLNRTPATGLVDRSATHRTLTRFGRLPQVVIAAIGGDALGGGCEWHSLAICGSWPTATIRSDCPRSRAGIPPGAGGTVRLARAVVKGGRDDAAGQAAGSEAGGRGRPGR